MLDLISRAILHPLNYAGVIFSHKLYFEKHLEEGNGAHSFIFVSKKPFTWKAGQHGIFSIPSLKTSGKNWRVFSIASSSLENEVRISTNIPEVPSDFKAKLVSFKLGDVIYMNGPIGELYVHKNTKQIVGIAGGIGITPFRPMLLELSKPDAPDVKLHLIYAGKNNYFTFCAECEMYTNSKNITISFVNTPEEVNLEIDKSVNIFGNSAEYFISGSPGMVGAVKKRLEGFGIKKIFNDPFSGY